MSLMVNGELRPEWLQSEQHDGNFVRRDSQFRHWITPDGRPGPSGEGGFKAEAGRYHLYVSFACPWAHRTLIFRKLKRLEDALSIAGKSVVLYLDLSDCRKCFVNPDHFFRDIKYVSGPVTVTGHGLRPQAICAVIRAATSGEE